MKILGQIIKESEIVGIGALYLERHSDQIILTMYGRYRFSFNLYLRNLIIPVTSNWINQRGLADEAIVKEGGYASHWQKDYEDAVIIVSNLIDHDIAGDKDLPESPEALHSCLLGNLKHLFKDLSPNKEVPEINSTIERIYSMAGKLRDKALQH